MKTLYIDHVYLSGKIASPQTMKIYKILGGGNNFLVSHLGILWKVITQN